MCLAIPGQILDAQESGGGRMGRIQFGGIVRSVRLDFVPEAEIGDYVMVHVGFAISRVDGEEAKRTYQILEEMGALSRNCRPRGGPFSQALALRLAVSFPFRFNDFVCRSHDRVTSVTEL